MSQQPGDLQSFLSGNLCLGCAYVHMCTPTLTHSSINVGAVYRKNNLHTVWASVLPQTQLAGGGLRPAIGCQQDESLKSAMLLITHYLVSALAAGLTSICCKNICFCTWMLNHKLWVGLAVSEAASHLEFLYKTVVGRSAQRDNVDKNKSDKSFVPDVRAAIRSSKRSGQYQIKPAAAHNWSGDEVFPQRDRHGSYEIPNPIK